MQPTERLLNLIAFLLDAPLPVTAEEIRDTVAGYDPDQSHDAFQRMFERDKDDLRELGIPLIADENDLGEAAYAIDRHAYYLPPIDIEFEEAVALRLATTLLASDPGYPLGEEIRSALAKLACDCDPPGLERSNLMVRLAPEALDERQSANLAALREAVERRKTAGFDYYSISSDTRAERTIEPYGLFNAGGHWYVVGRCRDAESVRTFRLSRIRGGVSVNSKRPKEPDYEIPAGLELNTYMREPWEIGERAFDAVIRFEPQLAAWARRALPRAVSMEESDGGGLQVLLHCADEERLLRWVLSFGLSATIVEPAALRKMAAERLADTLAIYSERSS